MQKFIQIDELEHPVLLARRKGTRSLRLSIKNDGQVRVSVPYGVPDVMARKFVKNKLDWIQKHLKPQNIVESGSHIGKNHQLIVSATNANRHSTRVTSTEISVTLISGMQPKSNEAQAIIKKACDNALLKEAKTLLPQRLDWVSKKLGINYKSCTIKKLKSRWGACDNNKNITLNSYLVQLEWELIDYVICHELAHTTHHHHQKSFWDLVEELSPNYKLHRKTLKNTPTDIIPTKF